MTKVNYYKVDGFEKHEPKSKGLIYGRSKKDVLNIATKRGFEKGTIEGTKELNLKTEVLKMFKVDDLVIIRTRDKKLWNEPTTPKKE